MDVTDQLVLSGSAVVAVEEIPLDKRPDGYVSIWVSFVVEGERESRWRRLLEQAMIHQQEVRFRGHTWLVNKVQTTRARLGRIQPIHTLNH